MDYSSITCDLSGGMTVIFDIPHTEADDIEDNSVFEFWSNAVG